MPTLKTFTIELRVEDDSVSEEELISLRAQVESMVDVLNSYMVSIQDDPDDPNVTPGWTCDLREATYELNVSDRNLYYYALGYYYARALQDPEPEARPTGGWDEEIFLFGYTAGLTDYNTYDVP